MQNTYLTLKLVIWWTVALSLIDPQVDFWKRGLIAGIISLIMNFEDFKKLSK